MAHMVGGALPSGVVVSESGALASSAAAKVLEARERNEDGLASGELAEVPGRGKRKRAKRDVENSTQ